MKRVLITGASGFIGRMITRRLTMETDLCVYAVVSGRREVCLANGVTVIRANLLCPEQVIALTNSVKADICVHLAWELPGNDVFQYSPKNLSWLWASLFLLQQFVENGGQRFVFAGSSSEYGTVGVKSDSEPRSAAQSLYGVCKRAFTESAQMFSEVQGFEFACARYFSIYGEYDMRQARAIPYAIQQLLEGKEAICKSPNSVWDYLYVADSAEATARLTKSSATGVVNIASGIPRSMREVFQTIAEIIGRPELVTFSALDEPGQVLVAETGRLRNELNFRPTVDLKEGLTRTIQWWKDVKQHEL